MQRPTVSRSYCSTIRRESPNSTLPTINRTETRAPSFHTGRPIKVKILLQHITLPVLISWPHRPASVSREAHRAAGVDEIDSSVPSNLCKPLSLSGRWRGQGTFIGLYVHI